MSLTDCEQTGEATAPPPATLSYNDLKAGVPAAFVRQLEAGRVLRRDDIRMIVPDRTLERRLSQNEPLRPDEADGIARLLRVQDQAVQVFGDARLADEWLRSPNPALHDDVPMSMARTDLGAREVEGVLGRMAHGIFG